MKNYRIEFSTTDQEANEPPHTVTSFLATQAASEVEQLLYDESVTHVEIFIDHDDAPEEIAPMEQPGEVGI